MSPFEIFRRNLKPAMIVLVGLSMFAFVVLPAMDSYLRSGMNAGGSDATLAEIDGVEISRSRADNFTRNHQTTVRFLRDLAQETIKRGGAPRTPGFAYDTNSGQVQQVGINESPSEFGSVRTLQLAAEANKAGFELDDTAIKTWLSKFSDGTMSDSEINGMLAKTSRNSMGQFHLFEQLRSQLLAGVYQQVGTVNLVTKQQMALTTPTQQWSNFLKLNRQASVDAYGLLVQDFYDQTNAKPAAAEINAVYEEGKERFPNRQSPEPAFRKRATASFEFVAADMKSFIDREVAKLSDEQIRAEYDKQLKGGAFKMPEISRDELLKQAEEMKAAVESQAAAASGAADEKPAAEMPAEKATEEKTEAAGDKDETASAKEVADEKMEAAAPATDAVKVDAVKVDAKTEPETPAVEKPATEEKPKAEDKAAMKKQVEDFQKEIEAARDAAAEKVEKADQSSVSNRSNGVRLVAFQDDDKAANAKADEPAESKEPVAKAEEKTDVKADDKVDADDKADAKTEEMKPEADASEKAEATEEDAKADADGEATQAVAESTPKVRSFEEARDEVARSMVRLEAGRQLDNAMTKARSEMRLYFNKRAIYESNKSIGQTGDEPVKPDLEKMAVDLGLVYGAIGPHDIATIADEPISGSVEMGTSLRDRGPPFNAMMFGLPYMGQQMPKQQLYSPLGTVDTQAERSYISWKTEENDAYIPELDEVRDEVIKSIRMNEARDLARAAADELAAKVQKGESLEELIPEDKKFMYHTGLGPFSWMQSFGFGGAFLGNVPKLDSVGEEFMGKVFSTEVGEVGVAANLPERVIFLVKPTEFQPTMDDLHERFKQPRSRMMAATLGVEDAGTVYQGFFESTDKRTGFNYQSPDQE